MIRAAAGLVALLWAGPAAAVTCEAVVFEGLAYTACTVDPAAEEIRLFLRDETGTPYGSFSAVEAAHGPLAFAMNAGMYHEDRAPVGLFVADGQTEGRLLTGASEGNFGLLPNGVFCVEPGRARVIETLAFAAEAPDCLYASQSGPLLLLDGGVHPRFLPDGTSRNIRNGVGAAADGTRVVFAISDQPVTFWEFAHFFRDGLGLSEALYFDGRISRLLAADLGRADGGLRMGPIVGVLAD
jgi:uncharacterized protein YigE (DUF2233 family)